jgi:hypothetical protein
LLKPNAVAPLAEPIETNRPPYQQVGNSHAAFKRIFDLYLVDQYGKMDKHRGNGDRCMAPRRGCLRIKAHAIVDVDGRPVILRLTGGDVHGRREGEAQLDAMPEGPALLAASAATSPGRAQAEHNVFTFLSQLGRQHSLLGQTITISSNLAASQLDITGAPKT